MVRDTDLCIGVNTEVHTSRYRQPRGQCPARVKTYGQINCAKRLLARRCP